jgi:carboxypeptidase Taq
MNGTIRQILEKYRPVWALNHASAVMGWDVETYMPEGATRPRGVSLSQLSLLRQKLVLELAPFVEKAGEAKDLTDMEKGIVRVLKHTLDYYTKVPPSLIEELERTVTEATVPWREAKKKSKFSIFKPHLTKIVELKKTEADKLGYKRHRYNALLDQYEEGLTVGDLDPMFSRFIPPLKRVLGKVLAERRFPSEHPLEAVKYDLDAMRRVNGHILKLLAMPKNTFRMDVSAHPFTTSFAREDVRITTRYEGTNFKATMYSVVHECGHAIYELQYDRALEYTPIAGGVSMGIHESQSRFWENIVGRSAAFVDMIYPYLKRNLQFLSSYDAESVYLYLNTVRPSLIRVDADELTYNFHIALRYELEKRLIAGDLSVSDVPAAWNDTMDDYLGVRPKRDAEGMLQDVHWSAGSIGYFPTYSLGNMVSAMIRRKLARQVPIEELVRSGKLTPIKDWLRTSVHRWGATFAPKELLRREFNDGYNPDALIEYLQAKFVG